MVDDKIISLQKYKEYFKDKTSKLSSLSVEYNNTYNILESGTCYYQPNGFLSGVTNLLGYDVPSFNSVLDMINFVGNKDELLAFGYAFDRYKRTRTLIDMNVAWKIALDVIDKNAASLQSVLQQNFKCGTNKLAKKMLDLMVKKLSPGSYDENIELVLDRFFQIEEIRNKVMNNSIVDLPVFNPKAMHKKNVIYINDQSQLLDTDSRNELRNNNLFEIQLVSDPVHNELYLYTYNMCERDDAEVNRTVTTTYDITSMFCIAFYVFFNFID